MAAFVAVGPIQFGGSSNGVGVYNGQNMQNAWDANSPNTSGGGTIMGQFAVTNHFLIVVNNLTGALQPILDNDLKDNGPNLQGP